MKNVKADLETVKLRQINFRHDYSLIASKAKHELAKATERTGPKILTQSFPYENHCECYKKLSLRSWPMLFTLT